MTTWKEQRALLEMLVSDWEAERGHASDVSALRACLARLNAAERAEARMMKEAQSYEREGETNEARCLWYAEGIRIALKILRDEMDRAQDSEPAPRVIDHTSVTMDNVTGTIGPAKGKPGT